jgi:hypothetical protein
MNNTLLNMVSTRESNCAAKYTILIREHAGTPIFEDLPELRATGGDIPTE